MISSAPLIRVALVEDDAEARNAVMALVAETDRMMISAVAVSRAEGLVMLGGPAADVLIADIGLPDGSGLDVVRAAAICWPRCAIMVSTTFGDEETVFTAIEAGAAGYLLKDSAGPAIAQEIRNVSAGGSPISPLIARKLLTRLRPAPVSPPQGGGPGGAGSPDDAQIMLSDRQREVLNLLTQGFTTAEIASMMALSHHTILTYVRRIYGKLSVHSRLEAIGKARKYGLLDE